MEIQQNCITIIVRKLKFDFQMIATHFRDYDKEKTQGCLNNESCNHSIELSALERIF